MDKNYTRKEEAEEKDLITVTIVASTRTKFYGPNEPKHGPIKAINLHRDPKGDQR